MYSLELRNMVRTLLNVMPDRRPSMREVLRMPGVKARVVSLLEEDKQSLERIRRREEVIVDRQQSRVVDAEQTVSCIMTISLSTFWHH